MIIYINMSRSRGGTGGSDQTVEEVSLLSNDEDDE